MANKGFSLIGLSTLDLDKTVEFYQDALGFRIVRSTRSRSSRA
jgi:catechol 2,3-dioxygenase-like lactoylglutathione lyase family enzyme